MIINIKPLPKPRMTRADKWKKRKCTQEYWDFKDELLLKSKCFELGESYSVCFTIPFPKSYSKKKCRELNGKPHQIKPDIDNLVKAINDCFCVNDSHIHRINMRKVWGYEGKIQIDNL